MGTTVPPLRPGDRVRLVSPSSPPDPTSVARFVQVVEGWGLKVDLGKHVFERVGFLAGTDEHRAADLNEALRDPAIRGIFATRGGKGAYRIADRIDVAAVRRDPKPLIGFSDVTILHLALWHCGEVVGIHGPDAGWATGQASTASVDALRRAVMTNTRIVLHSNPSAETAALTTSGVAAGVLVGGNLDSIATAAGWCLPRLDRAILFIEAIDTWPGHIDRVLTMLLNGGHLLGVRGVAIGHSTRCMSKGDWTYLDVLRDRFGKTRRADPGGLPFGHDPDARAIPFGVGGHAGHDCQNSYHHGRCIDPSAA